MKQISTTGRNSRRTVLRSIGAAGMTVGVGAGIGSAQSDETVGGGAKAGRNQGSPTESRPGHKEFNCPDGMEHLGTFEFITMEDNAGNVVACYFEQNEGDSEGFPITITDYETREGEKCEPVAVTYESDTHTIGQVSSFGGMDTHVDAEPDGIYESQLETPGGQQAAISLIHFCGTELAAADDRADDSETN